MKFKAKEYYLLPGITQMLACEVSSLNGNKDKVSFTFKVESFNAKPSIDDYLYDLRQYFNKYNIKFSQYKSYTLFVITFRASEVCHHVKPLGDAYNLIYA